MLVMKNNRINFTVLILANLLLYCPVRAQITKNLVQSAGENFVGCLSKTSDMLFYDDNTSCLMDRSPLSIFDGYLLGANPDEPLWHVLSISPGSGPVYYEKNYSATWKITGDTLYLVDLNPIFVPSCEEPDSTKRALFTAVKEATGLMLESNGKPLPTTWFSGHLRIKRTRMATESYSDWIDSPFYEISIEKGRIMASRRVGMQKSSPASDWLKKKMGTNNQSIPYWESDRKNRSKISLNQLRINNINDKSNALQ